MQFCYAGLVVPVRLGHDRADGPYYNVRSLVIQLGRHSPTFDPSRVDTQLERLLLHNEGVQFKCMQSEGKAGELQEHLRAEELCNLLRAGRLKGFSLLPCPSERDAKLFGKKANRTNCAAALADHALRVWPLIAHELVTPFKARAKFTLPALATWFDDASKESQTMVLARFIRSAFKTESAGTAVIRLIGLLVRDPGAYDGEGRTVWSQPETNAVAGHDQIETLEQALAVASSVLIDPDIVNALVEACAERPRLLAAVNDEFRAEGYTLEYAVMQEELEVERLNVTVALCKCLRVSDTQLDEVLPLIFDRLAKLKHFPGDRVFADSNQKRKRFQEYKNGWAFKDLSERTGDDRPGGARHAGVGVPLEGILSAPARGG
jgi:hypothetical protein